MFPDGGMIVKQVLILSGLSYCITHPLVRKMPAQHMKRLIDPPAKLEKPHQNAASHGLVSMGIRARLNGRQI